jgi:imidazoleglycerol phosphate synthase glutamine amidotransferase subunit HisH
MIAIIDYDTQQSAYVSERLKDCGIGDTLITKSEPEILRASHIILPSFSDVKAVGRKLGIFNLYAVLRLAKRPVLGLGAASFLSCCASQGHSQNLFGFFPLEVQQLCYASELCLQLSVSKIRETHLTQGIPASFEVNTDQTVALNSDTPCASAVFSHFPQYSAILENGKYCAVLFDIFQSETTRVILNNFLALP